MKMTINHKIILCVVLLMLGVVSFFVLGTKYSKPEEYKQVIASIEKKTSDAMKLTGTTTIASAAITLLPDDVATPIADKLAEFTQYFMVALCVLLAEKYMLPLVGFAVFKILVPCICVLGIIQILSGKRHMLTSLILRLTIFGTVLMVAIPTSIKASDMIYETYRESINATISETDSLTSDISIFSSSSGTSFVERATNLVSSLLEALAVTIATSCVVPILVLLFFVWLSKIIFSTAQSQWIALPVKDEKLPEIVAE